MKLDELKASLIEHGGKLPRFILPDGDQIPAHFHLTEVGHLVQNFIDCGGVIGKREAVVLQTWLGADYDHRLTADRFAKILELGERVLPHDRLDVEVEYDCCVVAQYAIAEVEPSGGHLDIILASKRTQCLAHVREGAEAACCENTACC